MRPHLASAQTRRADLPEVQVRLLGRAQAKGGKAMNWVENIKPRSVSLICIEHPEWGTFGVMEDRGYYFEIHGRGGSRVLSKDECRRFWKLA